MSNSALEERKKVLMTTRIIWAAMLMGQVTIMAVALAMVEEIGQIGASGTTASDIMAVIALALVLSCTFVGYLLRHQTYKKGWEVNAVKPEAYGTGNILLLAPIEFASVICMVFAIVTSQALPFLGLAVLCFVIQAINFPTNSAMDPTLPDLSTR